MQVCVAPDYIICNERVRDEFLRRAKESFKEFFGDDAQASPDLGRMVNERNFDRVRGMIEKTKGRIAFGGEKFDREGDENVTYNVIKLICFHSGLPNRT